MNKRAELLGKLENLRKHRTPAFRCHRSTLVVANFDELPPALESVSGAVWELVVDSFFTPDNKPVTYGEIKDFVTDLGLEGSIVSKWIHFYRILEVYNETI